MAANTTSELDNLELLTNAVRRHPRASFEPYAALSHRAEMREAVAKFSKAGNADGVHGACQKSCAKFGRGPLE